MKKLIAIIMLVITIMAMTGCSTQEKRGEPDATFTNVSNYVYDDGEILWIGPSDINPDVTCQYYVNVEHDGVSDWTYDEVNGTISFWLG